MAPSLAQVGQVQLVPIKLYNDVHFTKLKRHKESWGPFQRLPPELRSEIWTAFLRDRRMIEVDLYVPGATVDATNLDEEKSYVQQNHLGKVISGREYCFKFRGGFGKTVSSLLWVSREARAATLRFYRVHLPVKIDTGGEHLVERVLYLNPEYDLFVTHLVRGVFTCLLPDLLHDIRAFDPMDRGLANLALRDTSLFSPTIDHFASPNPDPLLDPDTLNPAARASFADIIQNKLRSLLLMVDFRTNMRGIGQTHPSICYHFAQTFPFRPRGTKGACRLDWLETDPRVGVEYDLANIPLLNDPGTTLEAWTNLEEKLGVVRDAEADKKTFQLYICPSLRWPGSGVSRLPPSTDPPPAEGSRQEFNRHLLEEEADWRYLRQFHWDSLLRFLPGASRVRRHGVLVDEATFERVERAPSVAVGMWVFPAEAFGGGARKGNGNVFDMRRAPPGLLVSRF